MAYTVKITYNGPEQDVDQLVASISRTYVPQNSYIDTPVYKEGYPVGAEDADKKYGKSVYATNVEGNGNVALPEPYATESIPFPVPLAQFKLAVVGEDNTVEFTVEDYKEAFYYMDIGKQLASSGFVVEVKNA